MVRKSTMGNSHLDRIKDLCTTLRNAITMTELEYDDPVIIGLLRETHTAIGKLLPEKDKQ